MGWSGCGCSIHHLHRRVILWTLKLPSATSGTQTDLNELAEAQSDVVSRRQPVLHRGPLTYRQRCWAYVLHAGQPALVNGRSALLLAGLTGWGDDSVHVLVPKSRCVPPLPGLILHETRRWPKVSMPGLPRTTVERAAVDAAIRIRHPRSACGVLAAVVQQRLAAADALLAEMAASGRVRHQNVLRQALHDIGGGSQALSEIDFFRLCRRARLPAPARQVRRTDPSGRVRYVDAEWLLPDGRRVVVEVDGAIHLQPHNYWADMSRDNARSLQGDLVLRFPSIAFLIEPDVVIAQLQRALAPLLALSA